MNAPAASQGPPTLWPLWRDLNVFVAAFVAIVSIGGFAVFVPLSLVLKLVLPSRQAELLAWPVGYVLVAMLLCWRWWKHGLSPRQVDPARQTRFRVGHVLLVVLNVFSVGMYLATLLGAYSMLPRMPDAARMLVSLIFLAPFGILLGLVMVLGARGTTPACADTAPGAPASTRQTPSAKWPPAQTQPGSPPSVPVVLTGVVVSSLMSYMAGVFGALAVGNYSKELANSVLPIAVVVYVAYVMTTFGLLVKRYGAANWVAWAPFIFLIGFAMLGQVVMMLRSLLG